MVEPEDDVQEACPSSFLASAAVEQSQGHHGQPAEEDDQDGNELGDEEYVTPTGTKQSLANSQKQRQLALFDALKLQSAQEDTTVTSEVEAAEILSLRSIMAGQKSERIISNPREYQMELFKRAKDQNTIAVLDTGSGKTLIAVLLLKYIIDEELESRAAGKPPRIAIFLTVTIALAFQQHRVLLSNLDQTVELIVGEMHPQTWPKSTWNQILLDKMVIVCTPDVLLHCLFRSFINIEDINLLIFDEAHHAKKNHSYAKIVRDFYICQRDKFKRPRIFGMTASPVDVDIKGDLAEKAKELETLLDSKIATASNRAMFQTVVARPNAAVHYYSPLNLRARTTLHQQLKLQFGVLPEFKPMLHHSARTAIELGSWCSDRYWSLALSEQALQKRENALHLANNTASCPRPAADLDKELETFRQARQIVETHEDRNKLPSRLSANISSKVIKLFDLLKYEFTAKPTSKCLIFVERKDTSRLLFLLAQHISGCYLKPGIITGSSSDNVNVSANSIREQALTMLKFRNDEINCLFATSVAEEGIDVPDCNIVIRFDLCKTLIQYIQSRGRARHQHSKFIQLIEEDNITQERVLCGILQAERSLEQLCRSLPSDRMIDANNETVTDLEALELDASPSARVYIEPRTGAKLTYDFSLEILQHFVCCIPHDAEDDMSINYTAIYRGGKYICEVLLPVKCPILSATGLAYSRKAVAKRSAAFEACILLRKGNHLNEYFLPTYAKQLPAMRSARLGLDVRHSNTYTIQTKPSLWFEGVESFPDMLYLTTIGFDAQWDRPVRSIGLLTRRALPYLPAFPLFRLTGDICPVTAQSIRDGVPSTSENVDQLTWFTLTVFQDLFNKKFEDNPQNFPYWIAPLVETSREFSSLQATELIDWDYLSTTYLRESYQWTKDMPSEELLNKFLIDPWDGGRRVFTKSICSELRPSDPVPHGVVRSNRMENIIEYSVSLYKKSRTRPIWNQDQPVIQVERVMHRLNTLKSPSKEETSAVTKCFICPEPFLISLIPCDVVASCLLFPAIIHRLESYLIALEMCSLANLKVSPALALEAITKDSDDTTDSDDQQIEVNSGMGPNYERLEFIGDCFLKMATSIAVFVNHSEEDEFAMHVSRMCMLCNKNLFENAKRDEWYKFIRCEPFSRRKWYPPNIRLLEGKGAKKQEQQAPLTKKLGDKTIADVCEAMIGAALMTFLAEGFSDTKQFDNAVRAVSVFVDNEDHRMQNWDDYYNAYRVPSYQMEEATASQLDQAAKLVQRHGYQFRSPRLARSAFTHPSQPRLIEKIPSYQRLEFLGDSLLDMAAVDFLFRRFPEKGPQWLTENKTVMISNKFLGALSVQLGFHKYLRHSQPSLETQIRHFVEDVEAAKQQAGNGKDYWTHIKEGPKCLSDIVESYIGAIFVDSKFDFTVVQNFFDMHIKPFFEDMKIFEDFAQNHPVTKLHKMLGKNMGCQNYRLMASEIPSADAIRSTAFAVIIVHDEVVSQYRGKITTKAAKIKVAEVALERLQDQSRDTFRRQLGCDCGTHNEG